ncbi:MAG: hypothetical protein PSU94_10205 [Lacunisphaera sp.]|nr:hypothetical protein [Lacunisphaera sp.]
MISRKAKTPAPAHAQWRSLRDLSSGAEMAILSARCRFSLATAEVLCSPADTFFALTEQEHPTAWRWAVYGTRDSALDEGTASSRVEAGRTAVMTLLMFDPQSPICP